MARYKGKKMATLAEAGNTHYPAMAVLKSRGYRLRESYNEQDGDLCYFAFKDEHEFVASSTVALLGIVSIWETYGENWQSAIREIEFDEIEMYSEDEEGVITSVIEDENGTRTILY